MMLYCMYVAHVCMYNILCILSPWYMYVLFIIGCIHYVTCKLVSDSFIIVSRPFISYIFGSLFLGFIFRHLQE